MLVRREPPEDMDCRFDWEVWVALCLSDLAAGRHAVGCTCETVDHFDLDALPGQVINACLTIAACALDGKAYEVEVPDVGNDAPK